MPTRQLTWLLRKIATMDAWIQQVFNAPQFGVLVLPAGFLLGLITAIGCIACSAPLIAAVVGYAGSREDAKKRDIVIIAGFFMLGTVIALSAAGYLVGYIGQVAGSTFGLYGKLFMAVIIIFFGFAALNLLPFRIPSFNPVKSNLPRGFVGASVMGLGVGGASVAYTMACCGPMILPVVLGLSVLKGEGVWGALILAAFAVGYSLPMVAAVLGIGLGKLTGVANKIAGPVRMASGILLIGAGFWLILTL
jgi:cytochrome c-type biogenesis protein